METKHTPRPWRELGGRMRPHIEQGMDIRIAGDDGAEIARAANTGDADQTIANAALMIAAPELLEACIFAYKCTEVGGVDGMSQNEAAMHVRNLLADAIAKATGEKP